MAVQVLQQQYRMSMSYLRVVLQGAEIYFGKFLPSIESPISFIVLLIALIFEFRCSIRYLSRRKATRIAGTPISKANQQGMQIDNQRAPDPRFTLTSERGLLAIAQKTSESIIKRKCKSSIAKGRTLSLVYLGGIGKYRRPRFVFVIAYRHKSVVLSSSDSFGKERQHVIVYLENDIVAHIHGREGLRA